MILPQNYEPLTCHACAEGAELGFDFSMAFQPIVNLKTKQVFAYEALARGLQNEPASQVLAQVHDQNRYRFDQVCRVKAVRLAAHLNMQTYLSINFLPNAVYRPETCIRTTLEASQKYGFPREKIIFEVTEGEKVENRAHLAEIFQAYKQMGFKTAIDDFGSGYSGLNLLAEFQPNIIKLDMNLVRHIDQDKTRRAIVAGVMTVCQAIGCEVIAEGIESREELQALRDLGIHLFQGYLFAKPAFEQLALLTPESFDL